jgi:hypothetical protein
MSELLDRLSGSLIWYPDTVSADLALRYFQSKATRSPVYAWVAIGVCIRNKKPFPDWVIAYLGRCADRMTSDDARRSRGVRKTLLWIFGFPKKKTGPGKPLEPYPHDEWKTVFAAKFAERIGRGDDPRTARDSACNAVFGERGPDDRTLQRYLREVFELPYLPSTVEEWKPLTDAYTVLMHTCLERIAAAHLDEDLP